MKIRTFLACAGAIGGSALTHSALSVCLDPTTFVSGYKLPLSSEIEAARAIVVGDVMKEGSIIEPNDPNSFATYIYTVRVRRTLNGRVPETIEIRVENDSGRYPMRVGEEHLLFLTKHGRDFAVNSCGNSGSLPKVKGILAQVEVALRARPHAR